MRSTSGTSTTHARPFWQTIVLTLVTALATYVAARIDTAETRHVAQQSVRVDVMWDMCRTLYETLDTRMARLESNLALPPPLAAEPEPAPPSRELTPMRVPIPKLSDPRIDQAQRVIFERE